jgi:DNA-binding IclR family transcriptional regulator
VVPSTDNDPDFTDEFCGFLQRCVANVDAAEFLLTLAKSPATSWSIDDLRAQLAPDMNMSDAEAQRCLDALQQCGVVARDADRRFRYLSSTAHDAHVAVLARLYIERPVTLFRVIYALRDSKIVTFADAFKLRG